MKLSQLEDWVEINLPHWRKIKAPPYEFLVSAMPEICQAKDENFSDPLLQSLRRLQTNSSNLFKDFKIIENECLKANFSIFELLAEMAEMALRFELGRPWQEVAQVLADATGFSGLRFLSAWLCLNNNDVEACLSECDKVDQPYAAILGLQGQALLESGDVKSAIATLEGGLNLAPGDAVLGFQLAKALHLNHQNLEAWEVLERFRQAARGNPEILIFQAMIALSSSCAEHIDKAFERLLPEFDHQRSNPSFMELMASLCFALKDRRKFEFILEGAGWTELLSNQKQGFNFSWYLKSLDSLEWRDLSKVFLDKVIENQPKAANTGSTSRE